MPRELAQAAAAAAAEFPLTVQLVSVAVPPTLSKPPPPWRGGVAADGAVGQRGRAAVLYRPPPPTAGGVAADGAVSQRGRAARCRQAAAAVLAELPLTVQLVSVAVPLTFITPPPPLPAELPLTVQLVSVTVPLRLVHGRRRRSRR